MDPQTTPPEGGPDPEEDWSARTRLAWVGTALVALVMAAITGAGLYLGLFAHAWWTSAILLAVLLVLTWIDLQRFMLLDVLTLPLIVFGIALNLHSTGALLNAALGAVIGYGLVWGVNRVWLARHKRHGIGMGDAKLLAAGGALNGALTLPITLLVSSGSALVAILVLSIVTRSADMKSPVPFGPFISIGIWAVWAIWSQIYAI